MASVKLEQLVEAPISVVWSTWDDYENIDKFHPGLSSSHLVSGSDLKTGKGARRQCNMGDEKNWIKEEIVQYVPGQKIVLDAYQSTMPLKSAIASFTFVEVSPFLTKIVFDMSFTPKMGLLGKLMVPMMKAKFKSTMSEVLIASAQYSEHQAESAS